MKILFFYPENPLSKTQGNNVRAHNLLKYFKENPEAAKSFNESSKKLFKIEF